MQVFFSNLQKIFPRVMPRGTGILTLGWEPERSIICHEGGTDLKGRYLTLLCALTLAGALTGCSRSNAPDVTAKPSVSADPPETVRPVETARPSATLEPTHSVSPMESDGVMPTDNYHAGEDGQVEGDSQNGNSVGDDVKDAVDDAGNAVKDAARGTGRAIEEIGDDLTGRR